MNNALSIAVLMLFDDLSYQKTCSGLSPTLSAVVHVIYSFWGGIILTRFTRGEFKARERKREGERDVQGHVGSAEVTQRWRCLLPPRRNSSKI